VLTVQVVHGNGIVTTDLRVRSWVDGHQVHVLRQAADAVTTVLSPPVDLLVFGVYAAISRQVKFRDALCVAVILAVTVIGMKDAIGRRTPLHPSRFYGDFPSGHTASLLICAGAAVLLSRLPRPRRNWLLAAVLIVGTVVAGSLIYNNSHWLSDVLASYALSAIVLWAVAVTRPASGRRSPS
jgi:undecaprenyl-diphosphatase